MRGVCVDVPYVDAYTETLTEGLHDGPGECATHTRNIIHSYAQVLVIMPMLRTIL